MFSAINKNTILVTFKDVEEPVEITLEKALKAGKNDVKFEYKGHEYEVKDVEYIKEIVKFEKVTKEVHASIENETQGRKVVINAIDQDDEELAVKFDANGNTELVEISVNGMELLSGEYRAAGNAITISKDLKEGQVLVIKLKSIAAEGKEAVEESFEYTIVKGEPAKATDFELILNTKVEDKVAAGDKLEYEVKVKDQYGNDFEVTSEKIIRWTIKKDGKNVEEYPQDNGLKHEYKFVEPGKYTVTAFYIEDSKAIDTLEVEVADARLTKITVTEESTTTTLNNHEAAIIATVKPNAGAVLTPEMLDFEIKAGEEETDKLEVKAMLRKDFDKKAEKNTEEIVLVATAKEAGEYTVATSVKDSEIKAEKEIKVKSQVNEEVAKIELGELGEQVLTEDGTVKVDVTITNEHGEKLVPNPIEGYNVISSNPTLAEGELTIETVKDAEGKVIGKEVKLEIRGTKGKARAIDVPEVKFHVVKGKIESNQIKVGVNSASELTTVEIEDGAATEDGDAVYLAVKVKDQYGNDILDLAKLKDEEKITVESEQLVKEQVTASFVGLDEDGKEVEDGKKVKSIAVKVEVTAGAIEAEEGKEKPKTVDAKLKYAYNVGEEEKTAEAKLTVKAQAELAKLEVTAITEKVAVGAEGFIKIVPTDQHGDFAEVKADKLTVKVGDKVLSSVNLIAIDEEGKETKEEDKTVAYKLSVGNLTETGTITVEVAEKVGETEEAKIKGETTIVVESATNIASVKILDKEAIEEKEYSIEKAEIELKAEVLNKEGQKVDSKLEWEVAKVVDKNGATIDLATIDPKVLNVNDGKVTVENGKEETIEAPVKATIEVKTPNNKMDTIVLTFVKVESEYKAGSLVVKDAEDIEIDIKEAYKVNAEKIENINLSFEAKDQFDNEFNSFFTDEMVYSEGKLVEKATFEADGKLTISFKEQNELIKIDEIAKETHIVEVTVADGEVVRIEIKLSEKAIGELEEFKAAKEAKNAKIEAVALTEEKKAGKTDESIEAAEVKLKELKEAAKEKVAAAETLEKVETIEVDKTEAINLLVILGEEVTQEVVEADERFELKTGFEEAVWVEVKQAGKVVGEGGMTEADGRAKINLTEAGEYTVIVKDKKAEKVLKEIPLRMLTPEEAAIVKEHEDAVDAEEEYNKAIEDYYEQKEIADQEATEALRFKVKGLKEEGAKKQKEATAEEVSEHFKDGLTLDVKVEDGKIVLGETKMTKELWEKIKSDKKADKTIAYRITVINGEEEAKIEFTADGEAHLTDGSKGAMPSGYVDEEAKEAGKPVARGIFGNMIASARNLFRA